MTWQIFKTKHNKIKGTPILKLAMIKRLYIHTIGMQESINFGQITSEKVPDQSGFLKVR